MDLLTDFKVRIYLETVVHTFEYLEDEEQFLRTCINYSLYQLSEPTSGTISVMVPITSLSTHKQKFKMKNTK